METEEKNLPKEETIKIANTDSIRLIITEILERETTLGNIKEHLWFMGFSEDHYMLCMDTISFGNIDGLKVEPIEIFCDGIWQDAKYAILIHNYIERKLEILKKDEYIADRLFQVGNILGISLIDYIIMNTDKEISFKYSGVMEVIEKSSKYVPSFDMEMRIRREFELIRSEAFERGKLLGLEQGEYNKALYIARNMLLKNIPIEDIVEVTGVSKEDIDKL